MGVPKFYRWLSERYPCLSEVIHDSQIPEFDNLYLDMNGIIHSCSHPNDDDITFRITEEQIFKDIFSYIEKLFDIIRPKKVFFMAVDGVAPRAKMNQQRARRFMSAKNAEVLVKKALENGELLPDEKRFDSNCITPGTHFMSKLHQELKEWVKRKVEGDAAWQGIRIYLSGHNCPGEGEHKIMDFIRSERSSPGYDSNTRHCMYGLDADLIMLGMCSHEPHFSLLREEVKFNRPIRVHAAKAAPPPKKNDAGKITFHLLHLSLLREYLSHEFSAVKDILVFPYEMERIIDDWVLLGFLVGNDFIPHLPNVHIHDDALPSLYRTYVQVLPTLDGYINEDGYLNLSRFQTFLRAFAAKDRECFLAQSEDEMYLQSKRGGNSVDSEVPRPELVAFDDSDMSTETEEEEAEETAEAAFLSSDEEEGGRTDRQTEKKSLADGGIGSAQDALADLQFDPIEDEMSDALGLLQFKEMDDKEFENNVENCWTRAINNNFKRHKNRYYREKLSMVNISKQQLKEQVEGYVRAIQWNLHYYYHGCCSWSWFFKHHYSPFMSDLVDFEEMEMKWEQSEPLHPFEQLLAVLPAASAECLPRCLQTLMCDAESPIADFYPTDFSTDLNGKKNDWEAVVLIPFINEERLLGAIQSKEHLLSKEEKERNSHGGHLLFTSQPSTLQQRALAKCEEVTRSAFCIPRERVVHGLLPGVKLDVFFPGFPTMKYLPHSAVCQELSVKVFSMPSRKPSIKLTILPRDHLKKEMSEITESLLCEEVHTEWPLLKAGVVEEIWTAEKKWTRRDEKVIQQDLSTIERTLYSESMRDIKDRLLTRYAIECGEGGGALARVRRLLGKAMTWDASGQTLQALPQWAPKEGASFVPLNLICTGVLMDEGFRFGSLSLSEAFPVNSKVFVMKPNWDGYGQPAFVTEIVKEGHPDCAVVVIAACGQQPDLRVLRSDLTAFSLPWMDNLHASHHCGMNRGLISRITGTVFLLEGVREEVEADPSSRPPRLNIGLNLKLTKQNLETPDYALRKPSDGYWLYSILTVRLLTEYRNKFRDLVTYLEGASCVDDVYYSGDVWRNAEQRERRVEELKEWLGRLPTANLTKQTAGISYVDQQAIGHLESMIAMTATRQMAKKSMAKPSVLYRPALQQGRSKARPDADATFMLLDRVTYTLEGRTVPFGMQGTVIGILGQDDVEVLFDREFPGGFSIRGSKSSAARVPCFSLINVTFARERKLAAAPSAESKHKEAKKSLLSRTIGEASSSISTSTAIEADSRPASSLQTGPSSQANLQKSENKRKGKKKDDKKKKVGLVQEEKKSKAEMTREAEALLTSLMMGDARLKQAKRQRENAAPSFPSASSEQQNVPPSSSLLKGEDGKKKGSVPDRKKKSADSENPPRLRTPSLNVLPEVVEIVSAQPNSMSPSSSPRAPGVTTSRGFGGGGRVRGGRGQRGGRPLHAPEQPPFPHHPPPWAMHSSPASIQRGGWMGQHGVLAVYGQPPPTLLRNNPPSASPRPRNNQRIFSDPSAFNDGKVTDLMPASVAGVNRRGAKKNRGRVHGAAPDVPRSPSSPVPASPALPAATMAAEKNKPRKKRIAANFSAVFS